ncbi:MAG: hypothetical protein IJU10_04505 [Clostridia bacterium]|nr:hypothetical protein [Clostridia bacterium]
MRVDGIYIVMHVRKAAVFVFFLLLLMLLAPSRYFDSVKGGVLLFTASVLPSMLPYFFFTKIFTSVGGASGISSTVGKPFSKMYGVSPVCGYAFVMSLLSGYPVGARVVGDLYEKGCISREDVLRASAFASTSGSMFVLGSVGSAILGNVKMGWVILLSHYLGAIANGFLFCLRKRKVPKTAASLLSMSSADNLLSDAMYESVLSLALVGGFIAVTNLLADMAADVLAVIGVRIAKEGNILSGLFFAFFEVTRGCVVFSTCALPPYLIAALAATAISFGGLSVVFQTVAFVGKAGVGVGKILLRKAAQAIITFVICLGIGALVL